MTAKQLVQQSNLPQFNMPDKYKGNIWDIPSWDIYENATKNQILSWRIRSSVSEYKFKFTLCNNPHIREELKYFMYYILETKKVTLGTFAEYYDRYKVLSEYVNIYMKNSTSIFELEDLSLFEFFLLTKKRNKTTVNNGTQIIGNKIKVSYRRSRFTTFIPFIQSIIRDYYEQNIPETQKLIWHAENLQCDLRNCGDKTLDFHEIKNPKILKVVQDFCLYQLKRITFKSVYSLLLGIRIFLKWLDENSPVSDLSKLNRKTMEKFFTWIRTQTEFSSLKINITILNLREFFDWGMLFEVSAMPQNPLIIEQDFKIKHKKGSKYLTDDEVKSIFTIIPKLPRIYGRMVYCLALLGVRCSELTYLEIDALKQTDDGNYYLDLWQYKTKKINSKPIPNSVAEIMKKEIEKNQKKFGVENVKYIFVNKNNKPISLKTLNSNLKKIIIENNILGSNGKLLHCTTHCFRSTLGTNLLSAGEDAQLVAQLLGQSTLSSLSHYATVANDVVKEQLRPRLEKDDMLIRNIGKMEEMENEVPEKAVALCNGFCSKNPLTTPCAKANACLNCSMFIPSIQFLNGYYLQLQEVEATISVAETNGYVMMLKKAQKEKAALEGIISKLEEKRNDK